MPQTPTSSDRTATSPSRTARLGDVRDVCRVRLAGADDERLHQAAVSPPSTTSTLPVANSAETR